MSFIHSIDQWDDSVSVIILINDSITDLGSKFSSIEKSLLEYSKFDPHFSNTVSLIKHDDPIVNKLIFSPTGSLNSEYDDSRRIYEAAIAGVKRALRLNVKNFLIVLGPCCSIPKENLDFDRDSMLISMILGACYASYIPLETREFNSNEKIYKFDKIYTLNSQLDAKLAHICWALEEGRRIARDIGGSDPERMSAPKIVDFITREFDKYSSAISITADLVNPKEYPLAAAVDRASKNISRHAGYIVKLNYTQSENESVDQCLFLIGKGITFDTGGVDVKINSSMRGMHRDKCGAAAVTGLMMTLAILKPKSINVHASCAFVRNSIGEEAYVTDEIVISRSGKRVRIGNTDAEGRMVMADLLCEAREKALQLNPNKVKQIDLITVATLTGHAVIAYGDRYTAVMSNGLARRHNIDTLLQTAGSRLSEPVEISRIRREDISFHNLSDDYADILQCNEIPSSQTPRGHMTPAGFLQLASGLDQHFMNSDRPLSYTHVDCAGSAGYFPYTLIPTGAPLLALAGVFILPKL